MSPEGRVLLFTGRGKGKTTAALGMAIRAAGHNKRVFFLQFVKSADVHTGESNFLEDSTMIDFSSNGLGRIPPAESPEFKRHAEAAQRGLGAARQAAGGVEYELIVFDEVCIAIERKLLDIQQVIEVVELCRDNRIITVLTGRSAHPELVEIADTVTEMRCVKHAFDAGSPARKGVEF